MSFNIFNTCVVWLLFILHFLTIWFPVLNCSSGPRVVGSLWLEGLLSLQPCYQEGGPRLTGLGGGRHRQFPFLPYPWPLSPLWFLRFSAPHQLALTTYTSLPYPVPTGFSSTNDWKVNTLPPSVLLCNFLCCFMRKILTSVPGWFPLLLWHHYYLTLSFNPLNFIICSLCYLPNYYVSSSHLLKEQFVLNKISALLYMTILTVPGSTSELLSIINLPNTFLYWTILTAVVANL